MNSRFKTFSRNKGATLYNNIIYNGILLLIMAFITVSILNLIVINQLLDRITLEGINYDGFRQLSISEDILIKLNQLEESKSTNQDLRDSQRVVLKKEWSQDPYDSLTLHMLVYNYNINQKKIKKSNINLFLKSLLYDKDFRELRSYYFSILNDLESFPVSRSKGESNVSFDDTWNAHRAYGGDRRHEGTDLMAKENVRGKYEIISMTEGIVEKMGWLEKGGYRIGIRSESGAYFYYAHLDSYADNLKVGDYVKAGQFLGYMGDSGYGPEGTVGEFNVHLHMGIYVDSPFGELSVNPYHILKHLEKKQLEND